MGRCGDFFTDILGDCPMSAIPPKADIVECDGHVRFVPIRDIANLFDHFVGARAISDCNLAQ